MNNKLTIPKRVYMLVAIVLGVGIIAAGSASLQTFAANNSTSTVVASEDAYSTSIAPHTPHGATNVLRIDNSPKRVSYIKFKVPDVGKNSKITSVQFRLYATGKTSGYTVYSTSNNWTEQKLTYNNRPKLGAKLGGIDAKRAGWTTVTLTSYFRSGGTHSIAIVAKTNSMSEFSSTEAKSNKPQLVIHKTTSDGGSTGGNNGGGNGGGTGGGTGGNGGGTGGNGGGTGGGNDGGGTGGGTGGNGGGGTSTGGSATPAALSAAFDVTVSGSTVTVDGSRTSDSGATIDSYSWSFGDGATASGVKPGSHKYTATGIQGITLTVKDSLGMVSTVSKPVQIGGGGTTTQASAGHWDHIVWVWYENRSTSDIFGNSKNPYINSLASANAKFTGFHGVKHPSWPNYVAGFMGSTMGLSGSNTVRIPGANMYTAFKAAGKTMNAYTEEPETDTDHNPWNFADGTGTKPASASVLGTGTELTYQQVWPKMQQANDYSNLPNVTWVVPFDIHSMDNQASKQPTTIQDGDNWLKANMDGYIQWAKSHNSLFVLMYDEGSDFSNINQPAPMIFAGAGVTPGSVNNQNLDTIDINGFMHDTFGVPRMRDAATRSTRVSGIFSNSTTTTSSTPNNPADPSFTLTGSATESRVTADASASSDQGGSISSWSWSWGDGQTSSGVKPAAHVYTAAGTYTVTLRVTDNQGATSTLSRQVTVTALPGTGGGNGGGSTDPSGIADSQAPTSPNTLRIVSSAGGATVLSWQASTDDVGVIGYNVYRDGAYIGSTNAATLRYTDATGNVSTTSTPGSHPVYTVKAYDFAANTSDSSNAISVGTTDAPASPSGLTVTAASPSSANLTWSQGAALGIDHFNVIRNNKLIASVAYSAPQANSTSSSFSYTDSTLSASTSYSYVVTAVNTSGVESAQSNSVSVKTPAQSSADTQAPSAPAGVTTTAPAYNQVVVKWNAATDNVAVTGYKIYRDGTQLIQVGTTSLTFNDSTVSPSTKYSYTVKALDGAGNTSTASAASSVTTPAKTTTPPPTGGNAICGRTSSAPSTYKHVVVIMMENKTYSNVIGSSSAPYITSLANQCGTSTNYSDAGSSYDSLPNYIALTSGSVPGTGGVTTVNDCTPPSASCHAPVDNIFRQVRTAGGKAISFQESMPGNCTMNNSGSYATKHNPAAYYDSGSDRAACQTDDVPMGTTASGAFKSALASDSSLPTLSFITPNMCNDMHDCSVGTGDNWIKSWMPLILNSPAYASGNTAVFLIWDEDTKIPNVFIAPSVRPGTKSSTAINHYSTLLTIEEMLGINSHIGKASTATSERSIFNF